MFKTLLAAAVAVGLVLPGSPVVTTGALLDEMSDPDANTYLDSVPWRGRLWSSYDRTLGNEDRSQYLRDETNAAGRVEHVMMDAKGPGALVRLWTANGRDAYLRFYFDGSATPLFEGVGTNLIGGHVICPAPLSAALSPQAPLEHQAQNLYLPLAYAKSLKVTVETPNEDKRFWYNAEVREYAAGTPVETVSGEVLKREQNRIKDVCAKLLSESGDASSGKRFAGTSLELKGPATIRSLALEAKDADARKVRVKMSFDGVETVDVSLAQLKGLRGTALSMPFRRTCRIETSAKVSGRIAAAPYRWDEKRSLYFHAKGLDFPKLPTWQGKAGHYDLNWVKLTGRGRLVGNALVVGNDYLPPEKKGTWWGEGDEKIWVDGEGFPSYFGTGTEDFFGYAWGEATPYDHPFLKMPESDRNVIRLRRLDSVPFNRSLKLDVEIWHNHAESTVIDYAPATFWYAERDTSGRTAVEPFKPGERVLFYGDSITHGGKYVCYLQLFENLRHPGSGVRLLNGGRSGGSARDGLVNLDRELKASRPDRAFVMFGMNDIGRSNWKDSSCASLTSGEDAASPLVAARAKSLETFGTRMGELAGRFVAAGVKPVLVTPSPFDQYNEKAGANIAHCNEGLAAAAEIVRKMAEGRNLETVDFHAPMTKLFRESAEDFVFCRDRVHPGNEGHLYMAALVLDAMGASPEVDGVTLKARADEGRVAFDYAPKALPLPRMPEYETLEAFYPLTERLNREIIRVAGLKPGRYTLAFDGRPVGDYSDEELAKGVNVALLDTPNQRRAQALVPVMRTLQTVLAQYRNVILVTRMIEDAKVDPSDFAAADAWLDKWLEGQKKSPWYRGVKAWVDGYRAGRGRIAETEAEIESLYAQLAAVRPASSRVTVDAIRIGGTTEIRVTASAAEERALPNLSSMACAWDGRRLKWTPNERHPITNFVRFVELMTATGGNADRDMGENFALHVDLCRKALAYGLKPYLKLGNVPVRFTAGCDPRRKKQGGADGGSYGFNIRPPDDYEAYGRYMRSCAAALRQAFGLDEVRSWRFSVMTEANNSGEKGDSGWFAAKGGNAATLEAFVRLYDVTAKAFEAELGKGLVFGTHLLDPGEKWKSFGYEDVIARCRPLRLLPISYYFGAPNGDRTDEAGTFDGLRDVLRAAGDGVISGIDEGRICFSRPGTKKKDLRTRTVGQSYQAAFNVRLAKTVFDAGGDYIASWGFFAGEDPLFAGIPTFDYFTAREIAKFAGMRRCAVRTDGAVPEKEVVDAIAAVSSDGRTVRVAVSRLRDRLEFADSFGTTVRIVLPAALRAAGRLSVSELTLDDRNNWFLDWERERREKGIADKAYWASPDDANPLIVLSDDSAKAFFRSRMPAYAAKADRVVPQVRSVAVPQDGVVSLPVAFRGNGAAFIELREPVLAAERKDRAEALEWFSAHQFGRTPIGRTPDETFGPTYVSFPELGLRIDISCHLPEGASAERPVPVFLFGDHVDIPSTPDFQRGVYKGLPIGEITSRGYAFVRWNFNDVCPNASGYNKPGKWPLGVIAKLATGDEKATNVVRQADSWGTIGAWAWGNSRVLDWIESRPELDARKVAVVGHSRGGKTALWTAAQDTRFAMAVSNGSGCGGAGLARERAKHAGSERFKNILGTFPNWFCPAFTEWIGREAEVPYDSDDLIRLIAPRLVYVASGDKDTWACPVSEKAAVDAARDIYRAYGAEDRMGYHCHRGPHKLHAEDWAKIMDFADRH